MASSTLTKTETFLPVGFQVGEDNCRYSASKGLGTWPISTSLPLWLMYQIKRLNHGRGRVGDMSVSEFVRKAIAATEAADVTPKTFTEYAPAKLPVPNGWQGVERVGLTLAPEHQPHMDRRMKELRKVLSVVSRATAVGAYITYAIQHELVPEAIPLIDPFEAPEQAETYIKALLEHRNYARAAKALGITESALLSFMMTNHFIDTDDDTLLIAIASDGIQS